MFYSSIIVCYKLPLMEMCACVCVCRVYPGLPKPDFRSRCIRLMMMHLLRFFHSIYFICSFSFFVSFYMEVVQRTHTSAHTSLITILNSNKTKSVRQQTKQHRPKTVYILSHDIFHRFVFLLFCSCFGFASMPFSLNKDPWKMRQENDSRQ